MVAHYFNYLKDDYITHKFELEGIKPVILFSEFKAMWERDNPDFASKLDDNFYVKLGCMIIDILEYTEMINKGLHKIENKKQEYIVRIAESDLLNVKKQPQIFNLPTKLPMVCIPKPYTSTSVGGYLFNDEKYFEGLFIDKKGYQCTSVLSNHNNIYDMVNKMNSTPFKINTDLLNYLNLKGIEQDLIMDPNSVHLYQELDNLKAFQKKKLASFNSKKILQETILGIADLYGNFSKFYFPVRLDQRGRLYCMPNYFNYQSNELSKALLLFGDPSVINKTDKECIDYLVSYEVNCFGGKISKQSLKDKLDWLDKNRNNILDFENGILLNKAKNKLLFLAFCIEYKRYNEFMENEDVMEFHTHLHYKVNELAKSLILFSKSSFAHFFLAITLFNNNP